MILDSYKYHANNMYQEAAPIEIYVKNNLFAVNKQTYMYICVCIHVND